MKQKIIFLITLVFFLHTVLAVNQEDRLLVQERLFQIQSALNERQFDEIPYASSVLSETKDEVAQNILKSNVLYEDIFMDSIEETEEGNIRVSATIEAKGANWNLRTSFVSFVFEPKEILLVDTNIHKIVSLQYIWETIAPVVVIVGILLLLCTILWIWSLVDCIYRHFEKENAQTTWILLIVFTGIIGSVLYIFLVKRKNKKVRLV